MREDPLNSQALSSKHPFKDHLNSIFKSPMLTSTKTSLGIIAALLVATTRSITAIGCTSAPNADPTTVTVEQQFCFLKKYTHLQPSDCDLNISADLPTGGPQYLVDSITLFLNEQLYQYFDQDKSNRLLPFEQVFSSDLPHLLEHYRDAYAPYFNADSTNICEFNTHCLELNMVAQTATYVTYEVVDVFFGEGLEEARSWVSFTKADGHRLTDIITTENLLRFFNDHPEQLDSDIQEEIGYRIENNNTSWLGNVGLLGDSLAFQYFYAPGIFADTKFDLSTIKSYLSPEAQRLLAAE